MRSTPEDRDDCWSSESEALFRAARSDNAPSAADRERVRRVLAQRLADPHGTKVAHHWGAKSFRVLQLGVGVTFMVAVSLAVKHSLVPRTFRAAPSAVQIVTPPAPREDAQPTAADTRVLEDVVPPPTEVASGQNEGRRSDNAAQSSAARANRVSRPPSMRGSAAAPDSARESARFGRISAQAPRLAAVPSSRDGTAARAAQRQLAGARTPIALASGTRRDAIDPNDTPSEIVNVRASRTQPLRAALPEQTPSAEDARAELVFMRKIQAAMLAAEPERVLALCAEHERRWAHGTFVQEREGLRAIAACRTAATYAGQQARQFFEQYPHATIGPRVHEACKLPLNATK